MIPKKQEVRYFFEDVDGHFITFCEALIQEGWVIQQIISKGQKANYLLLNKY